MNNVTDDRLYIGVGEIVRSRGSNSVRIPFTTLEVKSSIATREQVKAHEYLAELPEGDLYFIAFVMDGSTQNSIACFYNNIDHWNDLKHRLQTMLPDAVPRVQFRF